MTKSEKMDRAAVRTAADIEEKYNFGKSFAESLGIAEDARKIANEAKQIAGDIDGKLDHEEIFKRLTNNGAVQGLKEVDGNFYFNASYIKSGTLDSEVIDVENLFSKNINMTGTFTHTVKTFLYPGKTELDFMRQAFLANVTFPAELVPLYDFNGDGNVDGKDLLICQKAIWGFKDEINILSNWEGKVETDVTLTIDLKNPEKAIRITGKNMWGINIDNYIGVNSTNIKNPETEKKLDKLSSVTKLWSGERYMDATHTITLDEKVSEQNTGIVLKWEVYDPSNGEVMYDEGTHYTFVPKIDVPDQTPNSAEVTTGLMISKSGAICGKKTVFVYNTKIAGYEENGISQSLLGMALSNNRWVLTSVYGV